MFIIGDSSWIRDVGKCPLLSALETHLVQTQAPPVHAVLVSVCSQYVNLACWFKGPYFLGVFLPLCYILLAFSSLVFPVSSGKRFDGDIWIRVECSVVSPFMLSGYGSLFFFPHLLQDEASLVIIEQESKPLGIILLLHYFRRIVTFDFLSNVRSCSPNKCRLWIPSLRMGWDLYQFRYFFSAFF